MRSLRTLLKMQLVLVLVWFAVGSCGGSESESGSRSESHEIPGSGTASSDPALSIYELDLALVDQRDEHLALSDLQGTPVIAAMIYTSCETVCPRIVADLQSIEQVVQDVPSQEVRFVLFSLDPGRDTPGALRRFAEEHRLDASRWTLLTAEEDGVRELAAVLGVKYRSEGNGEIAHSAIIFLIDADGVIRYRQEGLNEKADRLLAEFRDLDA